MLTWTTGRSRIRRGVAALAVGALTALATPALGALVINEVQSSNTTTVADSDGDFPDWIELFNAGDAPISTGGYGLSDNPADHFVLVLPARDIPPGGFIVVWASDKDTVYAGGEIHAGFKLKSDGEDVFLTTPDGLSIQRIPGVAIPTDASFGRSPDGSDGWLFFDEPTPGGPNTTTGYQAVLAEPSFSHAAGFHTQGFELILVSPEGAPIHYTLDGSMPTIESPVYNGPVGVDGRVGEANTVSMIRTVVPGRFWEGPRGEIQKATVVRARAMLDSSWMSPVATRTFFVHPNGRGRYTLPVFSLVTDSVHLFGDETGIFVAGAGYDGADWRTANYAQTGELWERPIHVEYFEDATTPLISQDAGVRINGNFSRNAPMKSLRLYARSEYGAGWFDHQFFPAKDIGRYKRLVLRNAGNDRGETLMRDGLIQTLAQHLSFDTQHYRPAIVFVNGEYWGIHNMRDRLDDKYVDTHYDVSDSTLDLIELLREDAARGLPARYEADPGSPDHFLALLDYVATHDLREDAAYRHVATQIDVRNYLEYVVAEVYCGNTDWPGKNTRLWRTRNDYDPSMPIGHDGRWRWMMFDTEYGLGGSLQPNATWNTLAWATALDGGKFNPPSATLLLRKLLENDGFRTAFINTFADQLNTAFSISRATGLLDSLAAAIQPEVAEHTARWGMPGSVAEWEARVGAMRAFTGQRREDVLGHLSGYFGLPGTARLTVNVAEPATAAGSIDVNRLSISSDTPGIGYPAYPWTGTYFRGVPVTLTATPAPGYRFAGWEGVPAANALADTVAVVLDGDATITARFSPVTSVRDELRAFILALDQNAPNPFNPATTLRFSLPDAGSVRLTVHDVTGRLVATLVDDYSPPGHRAVVWDGRDDAGRAMASGVYIVRLTAGERLAARKIVLVR